MAEIPSFVKRVGDSIVYNGDGEFIFYVPEKQYDLSIVKSIGDYISLLGVINYSIEKNGKSSGLKTFNCPTRFITKPYTFEKVRGVRLIKTDKKQDYRLLKYKKGDPIIVSVKVPEEIENVEQMMNLFVITGNVPNTIPYDKLQNYFIENMDMNGNSYGLSLQMFGIIISELCRDPKKLDQPFRLSKSKDMTNYPTLSIKEISKMISPYSAIISENFDDSVVHAAMNKNKNVDIPLEKVLMGSDDE